MCPPPLPLFLLACLGLGCLAEPAFNPPYSRRNPVENENTAYACEDSKLVISCGVGEVIRINRANYGRFSISVCNHFGVTEGWNLQCMSRTSTQIVSDRCDGRRKCEMMANNHVFGDPCPDTAKYVEVKYTCEKEEIPTTTTSTTTIPTTTTSTTTPSTTLKISHGIPPPVASLTGVPVSSSAIRLTWRQELPKDPDDPTMFQISYTTGAEEDVAHVSRQFPHPGKVTFDLHNLAAFTNYTIWVVGFNTLGFGQPSPTIHVQTLEDVPTAAPTFWLRSSDEHSLEVSWESLPALHRHGVILKYKVLVEKQDYLVHSGEEPGNRFMHRVTGLDEDTMYHVMVLAATSVGYPDPSTINVKWKPMWTAKRTPIALPPYARTNASAADLPQKLSHSTSTHLPNITSPNATSVDHSTKLASSRGTTTVPEAYPRNQSISNPVIHSKNNSSPTPPTLTLAPAVTMEPTLSPPVNIRTSRKHSTTTTTTTTTTTSPSGNLGPDVGPMGTLPCSAVRVEGIKWPKTPPGSWATQHCPRRLLGQVRWMCGDQGWKGAPDLSNCSSPWMADLNKEIDEDLASKVQVEKMAEKLEEATVQEMAAGDITLAATKLLPKLQQRLEQDLDDPDLSREFKEDKATHFTDAMVTTGSNLLNSRQRRSWGHLPSEERSKAAASLVVNLEESAFSLAATMVVGSSKTSAKPNIVLSVSVVDSNSISDAGMTFPSASDLTRMPSWQSLSDSISIPSASLHQSVQKGKVEVVFVIYNTVEAMLGSNEDPDYEEEMSNVITDRPHKPAQQQDHQAPIINSNIISASMNSPLNQQLPQPVEFTLKHTSTKHEGKPVCSFWNLDRNTFRGQWSQDGCRTKSSNATHTSCECDHLTNFAILMSITDAQLSYGHKLSLQVITYVGCIISIICLLLSWITFAVFKSLQCDRNTIHKNLVLCLMMAEIFFLAGINQTQPALMCSFIAAILHYLFLACFAWMCLEGVQLYVLLIQVFENESSKIIWYYVTGYGVPAVVVAISAAVYHQGYGTEEYCWLSPERYFTLSFVGPVLLVLTINVIMLSMAIYMMCRHSNTSTSMKDRSKLQKLSHYDSNCSVLDQPASTQAVELPAWVKGAVVLVVLLGLTWTFGLFFLNRETVALAYIFTVLNSLQGLFIFIFHCLMNDKVQKEYRRCCRRATWLPDCIRVNYGGHSGNLSTSPNASSGSGHNYFSRFFSGRRRKRSTSTNSSTKPFLSNGVNPHRKSSTPVNSASQDSGMYPSTINGYMYTGNNNNAQKPPTNGFIPLLQCPSDGIAGDLSEVIDCSVVDSEFVTEYCHHDLQVSQEKRRYSTGSEDSQGEMDVDDDEKDRLSALSYESLEKHQSSFVSSELSQGAGPGCSQEDIEQLKRKYMIGRPPDAPHSQSERSLLEQACRGAGPGACDPQGHQYHSPSLGAINHPPCQAPPSLPPRPNASAPNLKFKDSGRGKSRTEAVRQSGRVQRSLPNLSGIAEAGEDAAALAAVGEADTLQIRPLDRKVKHLSSDYPSKGDDGSTFASSVC